MNDSHSPLAAAGQPAAGAPHHVTEQLKAERIQEMLRALPEWQLRSDGTAIVKDWTVPSLWAGTGFAMGLAGIIEEQGHSATIRITPTQVRVLLSTPEAQGLTEKDFRVAAVLEFRR
jgi:4a-hydroxytetrahydrobiopterin dehydratase